MIQPGLAGADALQGTQVDQDVDEGVLVGDGLTVAQLGAFDVQFEGLAVDALCGGALFVDGFEQVTFAVELVTDAAAMAAAIAGSDAGGHSDQTPSLIPILVVDGAGFCEAR